MPKFVDVGVAKPSFSSAYILTFKLKPPSYAVPSNFIHCTLQGGGPSRAFSSMFKC